MNFTATDNCGLSDNCVSTINLSIPCGFPVPPTVNLVEDRGFFDIVLGPIDDTFASGNGAIVSFSTTPTVGPTNTVNLVNGSENIGANGQAIFIQICDPNDSSCCTEYPFSAPSGEAPSCGTFPANPPRN